MSTIQPPPPQPSSTVPPASSPRAQVIAEPTSDAARVAVGSSLKGQILAGAPKGHVYIQTDAGVLTGRSTLPLPEGTDVALLLQSRTSRLHFQITAVNGQVLPSPHPQPTARAAPIEAVTVTLSSPKTPSTGLSTASPTQPPMTVGSTAHATLLQPAPGLTTALKVGSQVAVRLVAVKAPVAGAHAVAVMPIESAARSPALALGQNLSGNVVASTPGAPPVIATPIGTLRLHAIPDLPRGSAVTLEIIGRTVFRSSTSAIADTPSIHHPNPANGPWPALKSALETVQGIDQTAHRQVLDSVLPRFNAGLTSQTLFFLQALGRGNIGQWLGETATEALRAANPALFSQLGEEFRRMGQSTSETESGDWRVLHLPLSSGTEIEPVRLLLRRHGGERRGAIGAAPDTRFVVEVILSQLGRIQFDGLVREDGRRLDLIVRSDPSLPATVHGDIRALFARSSEIVGLTGDVGFHAAPPEFVDVMAEPSANHHNGTHA